VIEGVPQRSRATDLESSMDPPIPETATTRELIQLARAGSPHALDALCQRYLPRLRRWARGRLPPDSRSLLDTDDVVQDTMLQVVRRVQGAGEDPLGAAPEGYLRQAILNRVRDQIRVARRRPVGSTSPDELVSPDLSPLDACVGRDVVERYERALLRLSERERTAIHMRIELDLPYADVASALGSPTPSAARMTVARAVNRLAQEMGREA
jgi:RNA polymerase sigma factor (sigma-70 family)